MATLIFISSVPARAELYIYTIPVGTITATKMFETKPDRFHVSVSMTLMGSVNPQGMLCQSVIVWASPLNVTLEPGNGGLGGDVSEIIANNVSPNVPGNSNMFSYTRDFYLSRFGSYSFGQTSGTMNINLYAPPAVEMPVPYL